jgi:hypothetical protein
LKRQKNQKKNQKNRKKEREQPQQLLPERDRFTFEIEKWCGSVPVDPSYEGGGEVMLGGDDGGDFDLSGYVIPGVSEDSQVDDDEEEEEEEEEDEADKWEKRFGMGDNEYY